VEGLEDMKTLFDYEFMAMSLLNDTNWKWQCLLMDEKVTK
jgi:hypothetical protein